VQLTREKKMAKWLEQCSMAQLLDWSDCTETTTVQTATGKYQWSTE